MANKKGFQAVSLEALSDTQLESSVLSNWHKLNVALKHGQPIEILQKLLVIELRKGSSARLIIAERLRSSLSRAIAKRSRQGLVDVAVMFMEPPSKIDRDELLAALQAMGLSYENADAVTENFQESA